MGELSKLSISKNIFLLFILVFVSVFIVVGQANLSTTNKKAIKKYNRAVEYLEKMDEERAINNILQAIDYDADFIEAYLLLADLFNYRSDYENEVRIYKEISEKEGVNFPKFHYLWGIAEWNMGNYIESEKQLQKFLGLGSVQKSFIDKAIYTLNNCRFAISSINDSVPIKLKNLGDSINTCYDEYFPGISADGNIMVITSRVPVSENMEYINKNSQEDFYISFLNNGEWEKATSIGDPVNTAGNEGAQSLSADGNSMYFTACGRADGYGSCDIYFSEKINNSWSIPINIGKPINTNHWESTPYLSADGRTLYFSSNRPGGYGNMDIWKSSLKHDGKWDEPVSLGNIINTSGDELSPFIHPDGQTIYFSSDGKTGMGGFDLYISRIDFTGNWQETINLGYPVNTYRDEQSIVINSVGDLAFISSDRDIDHGKDIYSFELPEELQPRPVRSWTTGEELYPGESVVLTNVLFKTDSFNLDTSSFSELEKLFSFMAENQKLRIEIRGHTDNSGDPEYNIKLSVKRAMAVFRYLISRGIIEERVSYRGFGSSIPRADNITEEGKAQNRRTEFIILN